MRETIERRACDLAVYIIENKATVRAAAKEFGISKSTVHADVTEWNGLQRAIRWSMRRIASERLRCLSL